MQNPSPKFTHPTLALLEKCKTIDTLKQIHSQMITTALIHHTYPISRILLTSSKISIPYALSIFSQLLNPTTFLYNTIISSLTVHKDHVQTALSLYSQILSHKTVKPNSYTYPSLLKACGSHPWLNFGLALHTHVIKFLEPTCDNFLHASLLSFYSKMGKLGVSRHIFNQISRPDLATWNAILGAYAHNSSLSFDDDALALEALSLFTEMQRSNIRPNELTLVALVSACAELGYLSQGVWAHVYVLKNNLRLNHYVVTSLIDMYSKCGCLSIANQLFGQLSHKDTLCYNAMIRGFATHGFGTMALDIFKKMSHEGVPADDVTLVVTMNACSHVGLVEEGLELFRSMSEVYNVEPKPEHYGCLVDLLGRAGRLEEAKEVIRTMPMKPDAIVWRALLGGARVHGDIEIGEQALEHLIQLEPETSGSYVLLSNMYASSNCWDDVRRVRKLMKDQGITKAPGNSLVEIDGVMHEFIMRDKTHPQLKEINVKLEEMSRRLQAYGYKPRTKEVLFDIEEEDKEDALGYHSERLAIAFALLVTNSSRAPIRIIKNLRICYDCHESTKLMSMIYEREIIVRDRTRFHHFKDGCCSCLDYW